MFRTAIPVVVWFLRFAVGFLFLISGLIKVNDITGFSYKLVEYFHVFTEDFGLPFDSLIPYAVGFSAFIAIFETILAIFLLVGFARGFTTTVLLLMILFFTFLTGYSAITKSVTDCGCFGDALKLTPVQSFIKDLVLLLFIGALFIYQTEIRRLGRPWMRTSLSTVLSLAVIYFGWHTYNYLPVVDFLPYKVGSDLSFNLKNTNADGDIIAKDYEPFAGDCGKDELKDAALLVVMYDMEKADPSDLIFVAELTRSLKDSPVNIFMATATGSDTRKKLAKEYGLEACLVGRDETMLKTIIRSNPGFVVMRDGVVKGKWHVNARPTKDQLLAVLGK